VLGSDPEKGGLERGIGLVQATSANMLEMIGVGPFLTIPLILKEMGGPQAMIGWVLGDLIAVCDGLVWAELGAAMPGSGGPYKYLQEGFGPDRAGRLMSFLFLWGTIFIAPLSVASGGVGFSQYLKYFWTSMTPAQAKLLASAVCLFATFLLYRKIPAIGKLSVAMCSVVLLTVSWVLFAGLTHFNWQRATDFPASAFPASGSFLSGLGGATLIAMYDYCGYFNVCFFAGEVKRPAYVIPRSILDAIAIVGTVFLVMNVTIIGVIPWREAISSTAIISDFINRLYGVTAARVMTGLILLTTFASIFAVMLGYSRVPYAAAVEGRFFAPFARLHRRGRFPSVSVLTLGVTSAAACAFDLDSLIKALMILQIMVQFLAQIVALDLIRRHRPDIHRPFRMLLYPLPSLIAASAGYILLLRMVSATFLPVLDCWFSGPLST